MSKTVIKTKGLAPYLAVTAGVGCAASVANGAVTFYGIDSANEFNADPLGISVNFNTKYYYYARADNSDAGFFAFDGDVYFTRGEDLSTFSANGGSDGFYFFGDMFVSGAVAGDQNYANVSFDSDDGVFEAVAQFNFDGAGNGFLIAIATRNEVPDPQDLSAVGGEALSISEGVALINAAAVPVPVPEPSSLALLALGSVGLAARRRRKAA